jgi:hypothetical protein
MFWMRLLGELMICQLLQVHYITPKNKSDTNCVYDPTPMIMAHAEKLMSYKLIKGFVLIYVHHWFIAMFRRVIYWPPPLF